MPSSGLELRYTLQHFTTAPLAERSVRCASVLHSQSLPNISPLHLLH